MASDNDIAGYAGAAGFKDADRNIAVAVSLAESSGNENAVGPVGEVGLWQIAPVHFARFGGKQAVAKSPANARAAFAIRSEGRGWANWTTYRNGAYMKHMGRAQKASSDRTSEAFKAGLGAGFSAVVPGAAGVAGAVDGASAVAKTLGNFGKYLTATYGWVTDPGNWTRVAQVAGGGALIIVGTGTIVGKPILQAVNPVAKVIRKVR
jgi:hypothetical protein